MSTGRTHAPVPDLRPKPRTGSILRVLARTPGRGTSEAVSPPRASRGRWPTLSSSRTTGAGIRPVASTSCDSSCLGTTSSGSTRSARVRRRSTWRPWRGVEKIRSWVQPRRERPGTSEGPRVRDPKMWPWFRTGLDRRLNRTLLRRQLASPVATLPATARRRDLGPARRGPRRGLAGRSLGLLLPRRYRRVARGRSRAPATHGGVAAEAGRCRHRRQRAPLREVPRNGPGRPPADPWRRPRPLAAPGSTNGRCPN